MQEAIWHFLVGFVVSFLGSIPLGTVNLAVIQTTINVNFRAGFYLALGATVIELVYSAIAIRGIAVIINNPFVEIFIHIVSIPAFVFLGVLYFKKEDDNVDVKEYKRKQSFYNGIFIGLVNPLQIPFWIAYGSVLLSNKVITNDAFMLNVFVLGICLGTLVVLTLIAFLSKRIMSRLTFQTQMINKGIGVILFLLAGYELFKISLKLF